MTASHCTNLAAVAATCANLQFIKLGLRSKGSSLEMTRMNESVQDLCRLETTNDMPLRNAFRNWNVLISKDCESVCFRNLSHSDQVSSKGRETERESDLHGTMSFVQLAFYHCGASCCNIQMSITEVFHEM